MSKCQVGFCLEGARADSIYLPFRFPSPPGVYAYLGDDFQAGLGGALFAYCFALWEDSLLPGMAQLCLAVPVSGIVV